MKSDLRNPSADRRPPAKILKSAEDIMDLDYEDSITALADYDGPVRGLLECIIQAGIPPYGIPVELITIWRDKAMALMNVIYKVNGLKQRWEIPPLAK